MAGEKIWTHYTSRLMITSRRPPHKLTQLDTSYEEGWLLSVIMQSVRLAV